MTGRPPPVPVMIFSGDFVMQARATTAWAILVMAGLACSAAAQAPAPAPAAPPAASPDANLKPDDAAAQLIKQASDAVKNMGSLSFKASQKLDGMAKLAMSGNGEIKFIRNKAAPSASAVWIKGEIQLPMSPLTAYYSMFDGKKATWVDSSSKQVNDQPAPVADSVRQVKNPKDRLVPSAFFELEPFGGELRSDLIVSAGEEDVRGQACYVVRAISTQRQRETKLWLGKNDKLPRRIELISSHKDGKASYVNELWDLDPAPLGPDSLAIATPEGYDRRTLEPAAPPKAPVLPGAKGAAAPAQPNAGGLQATDPASVPEPVRRAYANADRAKQGLPPLGPNDPLPDVPAATANVPTPPPAPATPTMAPQAPKAGLAGGSEAPPWSLAVLDGGQPLTLVSLRGKTVVIGFWGSLFGTSRGLLSNLEQLNSGLAGQNVAVVAIACRTPENAARDTFKQNNLTIPSLLNGEAVARDYKIRGFPSTVIITPDGKVSTTIEGPVNSQTLQLAVQNAMAGKTDAP